MANEIQRITYTGSVPPGTATFNITRASNSTSTGAMNGGASAADIETELVDFLLFDASEVDVTGPVGGPWDIEFIGDLSNTDVELLGILNNADIEVIQEGSPAPPVITSFTPTTGTDGTEVVITGTGFGGATAVEFNGVAAASFVVDSDTQITAVAPVGVTTGALSVTTPDGTDTSGDDFTVAETGGSTVALATRGFGASGGTADQARGVLIRELVPGTLDTAGTPYYAVDVEGEGAALERIQSYVTHKPEGFLDPLAFAQIGIEGRLNWAWRPQFASWPLRMAMTLGDTVSDTDDGTTRTRVWQKLNNGVPRVYAYSVFYGTDEDSVQMLFGVVNEMGRTVSRNADAGSLDGSLNMRFGALSNNQVLLGGTNEVQTLTESGTITGGTYTITVTNPDDGTTATTSAINAGATAPTIQAALNALANVEPGDIVVTGGPVDTAPVTLTMGGRFASENVPAVTVNNASLVGGTVAVGTGTPGAAPGQPTLLDSSFFEANTGRIYLADDDTDLATINYADDADPHLVTDVLGDEWMWSDLWNSVYTVNRSKNPFSIVANADRTFTASLTCSKENSGTYATLIADEEGCTTGRRWIVFAEKCGTNEVRVAMYVGRNEAETYGSDNNLPIRTFPFRVVFNPNGPANIIVTQVNLLTETWNDAF